MSACVCVDIGPVLVKPGPQTVLCFPNVLGVAARVAIEKALIHNFFHGLHHAAGLAYWSIAVCLLWDLPFFQNRDHICFSPYLWKHPLFPAVVVDLQEFAHCCTAKVDNISLVMPSGPGDFLDFSFFRALCSSPCLRGCCMGFTAGLLAVFSLISLLSSLCFEALTGILLSFA